MPLVVPSDVLARAVSCEGDVGGEPVLLLVLGSSAELDRTKMDCFERLRKLQLLACRLEAHWGLRAYEHRCKCRCTF